MLIEYTKTIKLLMFWQNRYLTSIKRPYVALFFYIYIYVSLRVYFKLNIIKNVEYLYTIVFTRQQATRLILYFQWYIHLARPDEQ
jgi:hypothetical protein